MQSLGNFAVNSSYSSIIFPQVCIGSFIPYYRKHYRIKVSILETNIDIGRHKGNLCNLDQW